MHFTERYTETDGRVWRVDRADNFGDLLDHLDKTPRAPGAGRASETGEKSFTGTESLAETMSLARNGWKQGRDKLVAAIDSANVVQRASTHKTEGLDVAGNFPFVPAAVAGDPMCMVTHGLDRAKTRPVIRLLVNGIASAAISNNVIINRGAAILSWVDHLEAAGLRCEIVLCFCGSLLGNCTSDSLYNEYVIKRADEPLDIDRAAFMLAHPSMLRRLQFRTIEIYPDTAPASRAGYQMPNDTIPERYKQPHSVYFPSLTYGIEDWNTPALAVSAVERAILTQLQNDETAKFYMDNEEGN